MFNSPFTSYAYSYPHKSAYREISPAIPLSKVWADQDQSSLFLYLHIPFCEFRCGFCNLFTLARPSQDLPAAYLASLRLQAQQVRQAVPDARFARLAIGGGTPTYLSMSELTEMFTIISDEMGVDGRAIPGGCEASPSTVDQEKLTLIRDFGIDRLSLGVQSFDDKEVHAIGRPQKAADVHRTINLVREAGFPTLNLDLIYGGEQQSTASWLQSVQQAIDYQPEEIYLYPLYVRNLTGLGKVSPLHQLADDEQSQWDQQRLTAYREAQSLLLGSDYQQESLRMFRRRDAPMVEGPIYRCQSDAMVGLGCGARSYTENLHYSHEYAVTSSAVRGILDNYLSRDAQSFSHVDFGFHLDADERRRRHLIISLLQCEGLLISDYRDRFDSDPITDFPQLAQLESNGYLVVGPERLTLTEAGIEYSDAIGPWLNSAHVQELEAAYQWH